MLKGASANPAAEMLRDGGVRQWIWLGDPAPSPIATIECDLVLTPGRYSRPLRYRPEFSEEAKGFAIMDEEFFW